MTPPGPLGAKMTEEMAKSRCPNRGSGGLGGPRTPPRGHSGTPFWTGFELFWAKSLIFTGVIWRVRSGGVPGGVQNDPFLTHFGTPFLTPFGRSGPEMTHFTGVIWVVLARGVQKGSKKGSDLTPFLDPFLTPFCRGSQIWV